MSANGRGNYLGADDALDHDGDDTEAIGVYGDDPLGIMSTGPAQPNYHRYDPPAPRECTCPPPSRWTVLIIHDADPFAADPDHQCTTRRPGIDWAEVFAGLAVWRRA